MHYLVEIDRTTLDQGPTLLEENDQPVAVLLSINDYQTFRQWQKQVAPSFSSMPPEFADEVAAFERLKPTLQAQYGGQVVAIHQGRVVATGDDKMAVLGRVLDEIGPVPCYIEWVEPSSPRRARISSAWVKR
ncbi:MAG: hypothetical protein WBO24_01790 [Nitrospirales bacterium]